MRTRNMISFDWAMKRLLRNKANFEILEGFLSELLKRDILIKYIGESEGIKSDRNDKSNIVDIFVEADGKELIIVELQYDSEYDYFQRMLYGVSKSITEHINEGDPYYSVRKVYSISIVYFELVKTSKIRDDFKSKGMDRVRQTLAYENLTDQEKIEYWAEDKESRVRESELHTKYAEGVVDGEHNASKKIARKLLETGMPKEQAAKMTNIDEINNLR